jgi:carboxyl-terminal processing protease
MNRALTQVAALLDSLNDSHAFFLPPPRPYVHDYGFTMLMIGDHCYVSRVRPGSDAESKGLKPGDEIITLNGYTPTRQDFHRMEYIFWFLRPQPGLQLHLRAPDGAERMIDIMAKIREISQVNNLSISAMYDNIRKMENDEHLLRIRYADRGDDLLIVKFPEFLPSLAEAGLIVGKMRKYNSVVIDLRGNPGGSVDTLLSFLGGVFENKVKIGDRVGRGSTKSIETEPHHHPFTGKLVVLVNSQSASASELFARVIQLEKRGTVIGDRTSGSVMEAKLYTHSTDTLTYTLYGASITEADIKMSDGQSLENHGVVPDNAALPTASDLAGGRDPVLAKAAELLNVKLSPEEAGALLPYEWSKD